MCAKLWLRITYVKHFWCRQIKAFFSFWKSNTPQKTCAYNFSVKGKLPILISPHDCTLLNYSTAGYKWITANLKTNLIKFFRTAKYKCLPIVYHWTSQINFGFNIIVEFIIFIQNIWEKINVKHKIKSTNRKNLTPLVKVFQMDLSSENLDRQVLNKYLN